MNKQPFPHDGHFIPDSVLAERRLAVEDARLALAAALSDLAAARARLAESERELREHHKTAKNAAGIQHVP